MRKYLAAFLTLCSMFVVDGAVFAYITDANCTLVGSASIQACNGLAGCYAPGTMSGSSQYTCNVCPNGTYKPASATQCTACPTYFDSYWLTKATSYDDIGDKEWYWTEWRGGATTESECRWYAQCPAGTVPVLYNEQITCRSCKYVGDGKHYRTESVGANGCGNSIGCYNNIDVKPYVLGNYMFADTASEACDKECGANSTTNDAGNNCNCNTGYHFGGDKTKTTNTNGADCELSTHSVFYHKSSGTTPDIAYTVSGFYYNTLDDRNNEHDLLSRVEAGNHGISKSEYTLTGWKIGENEYALGERITVLQDTDVYPIFEPNQFVLGYDDYRMEDWDICIKDEECTVTEEYTVQPGEVFLGWLCDARESTGGAHEKCDGELADSMYQTGDSVAGMTEYGYPADWEWDQENYDYVVMMIPQTEDCPAGWYCRGYGNEPEKCPAGATSGAGAKNITDCYLKADQTEICDKRGCFILPVDIEYNINKL